MLIGIDPLLGPECLAVLRGMGHGDHLVLADANFPATSSARRLVRLDGAGMLATLGAVLSLLPVDDFEPEPLVSMQVVGNPSAQVPIVMEMQRLVDRMVSQRPRIVARERFAFYDLARSAYAIFQTSERAFYANLIVRKGVVPPPPPSLPGQTT